MFSFDIPICNPEFDAKSGNCDNGDDILLFPPRMRSHVNVPVITRRPINITPAALFSGAHVLRKLRRREDAQVGIWLGLKEEGVL